MKKTSWLVIGLVFIVLVILNIGRKDIDSNEEPIKIGVATLLSGDFAALGTNIVQSARLAVEEINTEGGINGRMLELVIEDSGIDSKTGISAVTKLISVDDVEYIVGGMTSNGTVAAAPIANENQVPILTPVTGGTNVDMAGEYIFRTANSDVLAGRDLADAAIKLGYKKIGTIAEVTEYTQDIRKSFEERVRELGGEIVLSESFLPETTDFRTQIANMNETRPEALFVASQLGLGAAHFIKQSQEAGLETALFTDFTFAANADAKKIVGSFDGIYFADPAYAADSDEWNDFLAKYKDRYDADPVIPFHAAATHDAVMMIAQAIEENATTGEEVHDYLIKLEDFEGLMGTYSLDEEGNSDLGFVVKKISGDKAEPVL